MNITAILFVISIICFLISLPILIAYIKWSKSYSKYWSDSVSMIEGLSDQILHHWSEKKKGYPRDLIQSQRYPFFFCIFTPNFSIELFILSFSKCQIYATFCKTYQTKCKTRYEIFKIEEFQITLRITQYRRKVFSSEFSFESWLDIFLYTTVPIFPLYDAVKSLTTVLVWALQLKNISRRIHPDGHKIFGYLVWSNFIIQKERYDTLLW